jgi:hypothetical protein
LADDLIINVKQIANYPLTPSVGTGDVALLQKGGLGGPYISMLPADFVATALEGGETMHMAAGFGIAWNGCQLTSDGITINVPSLHSVGDIFVNGQALATQVEVTGLFDTILFNSVYSFNGRKGDVQLNTDDVLRAGGAPIQNANFGGYNTSPTPWDFRTSSDQIATTAFVQGVLEQLLCSGSVVTSFNGRGGDVVLSTADVNAAYANYPNDLIIPTAPNPALGDASNRIATTLFVDDSLADLQDWVISYIASGGGINLSAYAPLASPNFSGVPTAPTAALGVSTGQLATTAFVHNAVVASTTGVASFNTRTGAVVLLAADVTGVGGALLASPVFTGNPTAPTAALHDNDTSIATTAYVQGELAALPTAPVTSFNTRTGAIVLTTADVTGAGGAPAASPTLTGTPLAPTAAPGTNNTAIATTAFVAAAVAAFSGGVSSFNSRTGAVSLISNDISAAGGALLAGPALTGVPTAPTAVVGTNTTQLATCAFVLSELSSASGGVTSFNTRTGAVTLAIGDITSAGGAPLASPGLTGVPTAPTAAQTSNDTTLATTAYVRAALAAAPGGVSSFNSRTGAITFQAADLSAVGGALLANPAFTGTPTAPTVAGSDNSQSIATTAWVTAKIAAAGGVNTFNGRAGTVTLLAADVTGVGGALVTVADTAPTGVPATANQAFWWDSVGGNLFLRFNDGTSTQWVAATKSTSGRGINRQIFTASGTYTPTAGMVMADIECVGGGAGGGAASTGGTSVGLAGGGGGSGGYSRKLVIAATIGASQVVTIGSGGAGGLATPASGSPGGTTSVGSLCSANGGVGGGYASPSVAPFSGLGGSVTGAIGDLVAAGAPGVAGFNGTAAGYALASVGGSSHFGGGGANPTAAAGPGANASNYGSGGAGAYLTGTSQSYAGGNGTPGIAIVTEYF